jgi:predicted DNA-binding ribbon-helix-helix protein
MKTFTVRLPKDKHTRLKALAEYKKMSLNKLIEDISTKALVEFDSEVRFKALAATGNVDKGLAILDKLDAHF